MAAVKNRDFVVVWKSVEPGDGYDRAGVRGIRLRETSFPGVIFSDGFESGDTSAW